MPSLGRLVRRRTLSARLIVVLALLLTLASATVGVATYLAVHGSLMSTLGQQLQSATLRWEACTQPPPHDDSDHNSAPAQPGNNPNCYGQAAGTFEARLDDDNFTASVVNEKCSLSPAEKATLAALPATTVPPGPLPTVPAYTRSLSSLDGDYRFTKIKNGDTVLITGLPLDTVQDTIGTVEITEVIVFAIVLVLAVAFGTVLVRLSLRPLRRVAATATRVTELPLDSGEVSWPAGVPDNDPRTEVGQVGAAFNRMLGHVERALSRRTASESRLRRFAADASHELRTPLSAIRGYAEFALRHPGPVPDEVTHALGRVQSESARMSVLVDDLLLLARLDAGRPLERAPVDMSRLAIDATSDARVARRDHRWRLDLPDDPVMVQGDEHRLHQVLANLLSNAGKHTPTGSTVTVALAVTGHLAELSVTDDGPGIPAELVPDLFERFTRADTSRAWNSDSAGHSTGLGLAIVDAVVAAHGGSVSVTSQPGQTRFTVVLPLLREPAEQAAAR